MDKHYYLHQINPIIFSIGFIHIYWYGFMYILSFICIQWKIKKDITKNNYFVKKEEFNSFVLFIFLGILIGGRLGYVLFYNFHYFLNNFNSIFKIWEGGMSFHGGLIGGSLSIFLYSNKTRKNFLKIVDIIVPCIPFGLGMGRIGNFINGELWGRIAPNTYFAILFPKSIQSDLNLIVIQPQWKPLFEKYGILPRHPSQIYEFMLEGILLFIILNFFARKKRKIGSISGFFLISYGIIRIIAEFFREPDIQIGLIINTFTLGQILSVPMIIIGIILITKIFFEK